MSKANQDLVRAMRKADEIGVSQAIANGADSTAVYQRIPVLIHVIRKGDLKTAEILLQNGWDPNITDHNGRTPLHHLILVRPDNEVALAKLLLKSGADPNRRESNKATPLELTRYGAFDVARVLIEYGAEGNAPDPKLFSIGAVVGDSLDPLARVVSEFTKLMTNETEENPFGDKAHISVDFIRAEVDSKLREGLKYRGFSAAEKHMNFQAVMPVGVRDTRCVWEFVIKMCRQASEQGQERLRKHGLDYQSDSIVRVLDAVQRKRVGE